ncbi:MAG TPA: pyruvate kinase [Candidatus Absconditabacterales bacterium]|nr:pyruvate kinase [Candidatus Absconditabacterales bacterium]HMT26841.1 pyruvate kinase [Candidatus Absconditabacterales bacterium]
MTSIIASIGPATKSPEILKEAFENNVEILRFNFSHFNHKDAMEYIKVIENLKKENYKFKKLGDIEGPSIRIGVLSSPKNYEKGEIFSLFSDEKKAIGKKDLRCDYDLEKDVRIGQIVRIDSGLFDTEVVEIKDSEVILKSLNDGTVTSRRHVNLPGIHLRLPALSEKDKSDLLFCIDNKFDIIAMSFTRDADGVRQVKNFLKENGGENIEIMCKIENQEGIENIREIADAADSIMVARGDLGTECPFEKIPEYQILLIKTSKEKGKKVVVATQMLESMINNPSATRAEIGDIFTAVTQGADHTMLSGETTTGKYAMNAIKTMNTVIQEAKNYMKN